MAETMMFFVLLLPLSETFLDSEVTLVKTNGKEPVVTRLCTNETHTIVTLIVCKIRTERSRREECRLLYQYGHDFVHGCDSRFTLMTQNQTVFLHLNNLKPEDSGNFTCECSNQNGTFILHLNITVEDNSANGNASISHNVTVLGALSGVTVVIIVTLFILGFICGSLRHRKQQEVQRSDPDQESQDIEPYSTFIRRENGLYSMVKLNNAKMDSDFSNILTTETQK
ncbi:uncharacterized protein PAE49_012441 isoform 2-T2 [Odontesthes bonariensis]|uniref:uncharacterized protein LOC142391388 isoform X2 n=1 Tax=Odontesthes bonariensis TaxID=219752 RepID=UPI003F58A055